MDEPLAAIATAMIVIGTAGLFYILGLREGRRQVVNEGTSHIVTEALASASRLEAIAAHLRSRL